MHVITKTLQIAPVFTLVFFPLARVFKYKQNFKKVLIGSTFLSGALCTGGLVKSFASSTDEELKLKAWKLQRNFHQTYYEDWTFAGSLGGLLLSALAGARFASLISGLVMGGGLGFILSLGVIKGVEYAYLDPSLQNFFNISGDLSN